MQGPSQAWLIAHDGQQRACGSACVQRHGQIEPTRQVELSFENIDLTPKRRVRILGPQIQTRFANGRGPSLFDESQHGPGLAGGVPRVQSYRDPEPWGTSA